MNTTSPRTRAVPRHGNLVRAMIDGENSGPRSTEVFWARWGFFIVAGVLGALLVISTVTSYLGSRELLDTIEKGQRVAVQQALRNATPTNRGRPTSEELERAFALAEPLGLRYVALLARDGSTELEAGERTIDDSPTADVELRRGDRMLVVAPVHLGPPPKRGVRGGASRPRGAGPRLPPPGAAGPLPPGGSEGILPPGPPPPGPGMGPGGPANGGVRPPPRFVMEIEMSSARALELRSVRDATIGLAVSVALMLGAFIFGRLATRTERIASELRHRRELATLGEMSAVLAHELRNPLAAMKGNAELLAEGLQDDERRARQARRVYEGAARMERLTEDLLDFVRAGNVKRTDCSPKSLGRRAADAAGLEGVVVDDAKAPEVWTLDQDRILQALVNLLRNAGQANEGKKDPVQLRVAQERGELIYEVRDHGPGVSVEDSERIFEAFVTTRTRGTGLGLSVVRRVAELHGGRVSVHTHPDGGAVFRLEIGRA